MSTADSTETSVMFSLAQLAELEDERLREERAAEAAARARAQAELQARRDAERAAEAARVAAEEERRAEQWRSEAEKQARAAAQERATLEVARIEAEAKVRLEAENAARAHELELLRVNTDRKHARTRQLLAGVVGLAVFAGAALGVLAQRRTNALEAEVQRVVGDRWAVTQTHEQTLSSLLAGQDRRHQALLARAEGEVTQKARARAEALRSALEAGGLDAPKLAAFGEGLDRLEEAAARGAHLEALDARLDDLQRWAVATGKRDLAGSAARAAAAARSGEPKAMAHYGRALDELAAALGANGPVARTGPAPIASDPPTAPTGKRRTVCANKSDPMCGPDGYLMDL